VQNQTGARPLTRIVLDSSVCCYGDYFSVVERIS
jgi:hypothetical protein